MPQRRERGARRRAGRGGPETQACGCKDPGAPEPQLCPGPDWSGAEGRRREGTDPRSRQDQGRRTTCPCLSPESSRSAQRRGREAQKLSHMPFHSHTLSLSPDPCSLRTAAAGAAPGLAEAGGWCQGGGSYLQFPAPPRRGYPPPGPGLGRGQLSAPRLPLLRLPRRPLLLQQPLLRLRSGPSPPPRTAHTRTSLAA